MTAEERETTNNLLHLGAGAGSKVEQIKAESQHLRGQIAEELQSESSHFSEAQIQLLNLSRHAWPGCCRDRTPQSRGYYLVVDLLVCYTISIY